MHRTGTVQNLHAIFLARRIMTFEVPKKLNKKVLDCYIRLLLHHILLNFVFQLKPTICISVAYIFYAAELNSSDCNCDVIGRSSFLFHLDSVLLSQPFSEILFLDAPLKLNSLGSLRRLRVDLGHSVGCVRSISAVRKHYRGDWPGSSRPERETSGVCQAHNRWGERNLPCTIINNY